MNYHSEDANDRFPGDDNTFLQAKINWYVGPDERGRLHLFFIPLSQKSDLLGYTISSQNASSATTWGCCLLVF